RVAPPRPSTIWRSWLEIDLSRLCNSECCRWQACPAQNGEIGSDRNAIILSAEAHTLGHREQLEKFRRICNRVGGEARMQVLQHFDVAAPAIEGQVSGAH